MSEVVNRIPTFACTSWEGDHLMLHVAIPFYQVQPPQGSLSWGATKCGRAMRLNSTHPNTKAQCVTCFKEYKT